MLRCLLWATGAVVVLALLAMLMPRARESTLSAAGRLIAVDPPAVGRADIIVVAIDADGAGTLEASDLVRSGVSDQVAVFQDPPTPVDREFLRRGLPYEDRGAISTLQLRALGIANIIRIPRSASGSNEEGQILPAWCTEHGYRSVILVTSWDHSRRLARILQRSTKGYRVKITVYGSHYSPFSPDLWWKSRAGVRLGIEEFEKLLLDMICHPFS